MVLLAVEWGMGWRERMESNEPLGHCSGPGWRVVAVTGIEVVEVEWTKIVGVKLRASRRVRHELQRSLQLRQWGHGS